MEELKTLNLTKKIFNIVRENPKSRRTKKKQNLTIYKRHDKSLFELSKRFLKKHSHLEDYVINLEFLTTELDIERRRLYDIINILESLGIIYRVSKNCFMWKGLGKARENIIKFQKYFGKDVQGNEFKSRKEMVQEFIEREYHHFNMKKKTNKREKSLAILSLNLVFLFYRSNSLQTLEQTAQNLANGETSKLKTRIRRLYDITNVFKSMGLIKKTTTKDRKIAIQWLGLEGFDSFIKQIQSPRKQLDDKKSAFAFVKKEPVISKDGFSLLGKRQLLFNDIASTSLEEDAEESNGSPVVDIESIMVKNFMKIINGKDPVKKKLKVFDSEMTRDKPCIGFGSQMGRLFRQNDENMDPNIEVRADDLKIILPLGTKKTQSYTYSKPNNTTVVPFSLAREDKRSENFCSLGKTNSSSAFNFIFKKR